MVTLRRALKKNGLSFKRIRHSLKARRDEADFRNTQGLLKVLHQRAKTAQELGVTQSWLMRRVKRYVIDTAGEEPRAK